MLSLSIFLFQWFFLLSHKHIGIKNNVRILAIWSPPSIIVEEFKKLKATHQCNNDDIFIKYPLMTRASIKILIHLENNILP